MSGHAPQYGQASPERKVERQREQNAIAGRYCLDCGEPAAWTAVWCPHCLTWNLARRVR